MVCKSRISKKDITIPRLELESAHMSSNLLSSILSTLKTENITSVITWTDSTLVLCFLNQSESYKSFAANRVHKIKQTDDIRNVPTKQSPVDIESRGSLISKLPNVWLEDPFWLTNSSEWSNQPIIHPALESQREAKLQKKITVNTIEIANAFNKLLDKYELQKELRVSAWVNRIIKNCQVL